MDKKINRKKIINEKPVSLNPLNLQQALEALLIVKHQPKKPKNKRSQKNEKSSD
jgi:hypothetical protein